jgi:DNA-binding NtrC family response regulator
VRHPRKFLVVDDNADSRFLLTKTLMRKFPSAAIVETGDDATAAAIAASEVVDAIIIHRTGEVTGIEMVRLLRGMCPDVPIVMVSGIDRAPEARKAGASYFLLYDEWLRLGTVVTDLLQTGKAGSNSPFRAGEKTPGLSPA